MKLYQVIVLVVFGLLALLGLVLFASYSGLGSGGVKIGAVTIWGTIPQEAMDAGLASLKKTNKEYKDAVYIEKSPTEIDAQLADALASGTGPDLVMITQEQLLAQQNKLTLIPFSSLSERSFINTYAPLNELYLTSEGFYAVPVVVDPLVLYYNRQLLSSAGVATPPTSWEAVTGLAEKLTVRRPDQSIQKSAIALGGYGNVTDARAILSLLLLQAGVPITQRTTTGHIQSTLDSGSDISGNSPAASALNFYTQFANPVKTVYSWNRSLPNSQQAFLAGDLALYIGYASEQKFLAEANPNLDFDMAPIPQPATGGASKTYGLAYALAVPKAAGNAGGAFQTAFALTFAEPMQAIAQAAGMAPARRPLLSTFPDRYAEVYYPQALTSVGWLSPAPATVDTIFSAMIDNITTGRKDVPTSVISAHQTLTASLP